MVYNKIMDCFRPKGLRNDENAVYNKMTAKDIFSSDKVFSVTEVSTLIKSILEGTFPAISVAGELTGWKRSPSGHIYFALKDSKALIKCVMWRDATNFLTFEPRDGDKIQVTGRLTTYIAQGAYQIVCDVIKKIGTGDILEQLEILKKRLAAEGLFDNAHKRPLPHFPNVIGVVTSPTGAAIEDIKRVTSQRNPNVKIILFPAVVQGDESAAQIVNAIKKANEYPMPPDILIVGRGGGSIEDLLPFSDESVVRAVYNSKIPVISAVGHEIDWAICDFSADVRAATPSNAAEIAVPKLLDILEMIDNYKQDLYSATTNRLDSVKNIANKDTFYKHSKLSLLLKLQSIESNFESQKGNFYASFEKKFTHYKSTVDKLKMTLNAASPQSTLNRGYAILKNTDTAIFIKDISQVKTGDNITAIIKSGEIKTKVL